VGALASVALEEDAVQTELGVAFWGGTSSMNATIATTTKRMVRKAAVSYLELAKRHWIKEGDSGKSVYAEAR
jgi:hypothetical protein